MDPVRRDVFESPICCEGFPTFTGFLVFKHVCLHGKTLLLSPRLLQSSRTLIVDQEKIVFSASSGFFPILSSSLFVSSNFRVHVLKSSILVGGPDSFWEATSPFLAVSHGIFGLDSVCEASRPFPTGRTSGLRIKDLSRCRDNTSV